tara:strand:+ start:221 stop:544 length:324 start_codon:yes stop_codon:yes gene_type:complete
MKIQILLSAIALLFWTTSAAADSADARCDIYPAGEDQAEKMIHCTFSQRQGYITITREDGVTHDLSPFGDGPGNFRDQDGRDGTGKLTSLDRPNAGLGFKQPLFPIL